MDKNKNASALDQFVLHWGQYKNHFEWNGKEVAIFPAFITYNADGRERTIKTTVQLYHETHIVQIIPNEWLTAEQFYTQFDPGWQTFNFNQGKALHIEGKGPKHKDPYWISILPE